MKLPIHHRSKGTHDMMIDEEDYDKVKDLNLTLNYTSNRHTFYAQHRVYENKKYSKTIHIHRLIMGLGTYKEDKRQVNHIDGDGLNNAKSNLEICDAMYNSQSFRQPHRKQVGFIYQDKSMNRNKCWRFGITINGKFHTKRFLTEEEAIEYKKNYIENQIKK